MSRTYMRLSMVALDRLIDRLTAARNAAHNSPEALQKLDYILAALREWRNEE